MNDTHYAQRIVLALLLGLAPIAVPAMWGAPVGIQLTTTEKQQLQREARLVVDLLQNHHYSGRAFREIQNAEMVGRFIQELDPWAYFLTVEDVGFIHRRFDRTLKSVYLYRGDLSPAFEIYDLFAGRAAERLAWIKRRLERDIDLASGDSFTETRQPEPVAAGPLSDRRWEQRLQDLVITEIIAGRTPEAARTKVAERFAETGRRIAAIDSFAIRERFLDAAIRSFDPHSGYFSADSSREFEVDMENAVVGLGLDLRKEEGRCVVAAVQPGGPADLHTAIQPGDSIVALAEGDGPWIDTASKRLREIVALVRGRAGGKLRVAYEPEGTSRRTEVTLERTRVVLVHERAHGAISVVPGPSGAPRRIGWISLPDFYAGGKDDDATSAAKDVRELLAQMVAQKIDGLVMDLRTNPGGALTEAVAMCQLFLPRGTIMLSRGPTGKPEAHPLKEKPPAYSGPLVVLTSERSASASEIFAGAMKHYGRAVIVGGAATYGKGTAQSYIALAKMPGIDAKAAKDWGTLRLTAQRFYLPDGQAVQRTGVPSQIVLPDCEVPGWQREAALPRALTEESLPPEAIPTLPVVGPPAAPAPLQQHLQQQAAKDIAELPEWKLWRAEQKYTRELFDRTARSLNLATRQGQWAEALASFQSQQRTRRTLTAGAAFETQPLEIASAQAANDAHEAKLRLPGQPGLYRLRRSGFLVTTDRGHWREIHLAEIPAPAFLGDVDALAAAFAEGSGQPLTSAQAGRILQALDLLEHKTEAALLAAVHGITGNTLPEAAVRGGTEALLRRVTELDSEICRERAGLDIPLRQSLRLAAAWADWVAHPSLP